MDKETWEKIQQGDNQAFAAFYFDHISLLYGYGIKIVQNKELVGEYIQSLFIYIWEHRTTLSCPQRSVSYLAASLRNMIIRDQKKIKNFDTVRIDDSTLNYKFELIPDIQATLEKNEIDSKQLYELDEALKSLTAREREVIYLRYYKNMSIDDVAIVMGVKSQYICNVVSRAIKKLRVNPVLSKAFLLALIYMLKDIH